LLFCPADQFGLGFAATGLNNSGLIAAKGMQGMDAKRKRRLPRARVLAIALFLACLIVGLVGWRAFPRRARSNARLARLLERETTVVLDKETESRIVAFCSDCHGMPRPENYPQYAWRKEVLRGYEFYARSGRNDLVPPPVNLAIAYYEARAPLEQVFAEPEEADSQLSVEFTVQTVKASPSSNLAPGVAHLRWTRLEQDAPSVLLACDMREGTVFAIDLADRSPRFQTLSRLSHPCHVEPCDIDRDGNIELLVVDVGSLYGADDYNRGRIVWLRPRNASRAYEEVVIASELGRVCDVRPADVDLDGDLDLLVADFGGYLPGSIMLLRNVSEDGEPVRFETEKLDGRPGAIHLPVHDLNHDGRPDFVALVSQDFERVEAFINRGDGQFYLQTLWSAPDPSFGSSGMELADMDRDGDVDILFTNGDSFDDGYVKPCHGVHWLENLGDLSFAHHRLTDLPGAYRALAGDIDLDGDLDVVATVWVEPEAKFLNPALKHWASLVCLEQTSPGKFVRHTLETDFPWHATIEMADFDADGDLDLAVGSHSRKLTFQLPYWLAIWWNQAT